MTETAAPSYISPTVSPGASAVVRSRRVRSYRHHHHHSSQYHRTNRPRRKKPSLTMPRSRSGSPPRREKRHRSSSRGRDRETGSSRRRERERSRSRSPIPPRRLEEARAAVSEGSSPPRRHRGEPSSRRNGSGGDGEERRRPRHPDAERRDGRERGAERGDRNHYQNASPPSSRGGGSRRDSRSSAFGEGGGGSEGRRGQGGEKSFEQQPRYEWGKPAEEEEGAEKKPMVVDKANFGLTGALAKDAQTGNVYKGVVLKWTEPDDARKPERGWRLYVFKNGEIKETLHLHRQSAYLIGRHDVADLKVEHPSCSKQHAVIQFRQREVKGAAPGSVKLTIKPYIMDLESVNKTRLNGEELPPARYVELRAQDTIQFGLSTREYVLMHEGMVGAGGGDEED